MRWSWSGARRAGHRWPGRGSAASAPPCSSRPSGTSRAGGSRSTGSGPRVSPAPCTCRSRRSRTGRAGGADRRARKPRIWGRGRQKQAGKAAKEERMDKGWQDKVRARAHAIWEREGQPEGGAERHWAQAEEELRAEGRGRAEMPVVEAAGSALGAVSTAGTETWTGEGGAVGSDEPE